LKINNILVNQLPKNFLLNRYKRSKLERQMNVEIIWCVVTLLFLCLIGAIGSGVWLNGLILPNSDYVAPFLCTLVHPSPGFEGFLTFWTFIIIFQVIIPLSLYVTIELTKLAQIHLIHQARHFQKNYLIIIFYLSTINYRTH